MGLHESWVADHRRPYDMHEPVSLVGNVLGDRLQEERGDEDRNANLAIRDATRYACILVSTGPGPYYNAPP